MSGDDFFFRRFPDGIEYCRFRNLGQTFPPHFHDHYVLGCLLSGRRQIILNSSESCLKSGQTILIRPGAVHACAHLGNAPDVWVCLNIPASAIDEHMEACLRKAARISEPPGAEDLFARLDSQISRQRTWRPLMRKIITLLPQESREEPAEGTHPDADIITLLCDYMKDHLHEIVSLDDMSSAAGMDKFRLSRSFRVLKNITMSRYQENLRLNLAREMLAKGKNICSTALETGFYDQSHFDHRFKKNMGFPPLAIGRQKLESK